MREVLLLLPVYLFQYTYVNDLYEKVKRLSLSNNFKCWIMFLIQYPIEIKKMFEACCS